MTMEIATQRAQHPVPQTKTTDRSEDVGIWVREDHDTAVGKESLVVDYLFHRWQAAEHVPELKSQYVIH